uniref:Uncharacterized protein n=1 Tax=Romanomermis culicivorax TaxID=13658 RepID=A0A915IZI2_ROMCU
MTAILRRTTDSNLQPNGTKIFPFVRLRSVDCMAFRSVGKGKLSPYSLNVSEYPDDLRSSKKFCDHITLIFEFLNM